MGTTTTTFALNKPTVGGDDNAWGGDWNSNADKLDDLLDGTTGITPNLIAGWEVGGVAVTSTAAELNILDGVTATTAELNILGGVTASTAELNILDGVTSTAAELNILDGVTATTAELNVLDGVTATTAELNVLDGIAGIASQAEAEAGTATDKLMTPERTKQAIDGQVGVANAAPVKTALNATGSAPIFACRAWVNFNGTGTVAIRASGNVSSITDNGTGDYTVNFTTAMPDTNYSVVTGGHASTSSSAAGRVTEPYSLATNSVAIATAASSNGGAADNAIVCVAIFR
jgi:hypothetical protein